MSTDGCVKTTPPLSSQRPMTGPRARRKRFETGVVDRHPIAVITRLVLAHQLAPTTTPIYTHLCME